MESPAMEQRGNADQRCVRVDPEILSKVVDEDFKGRILTAVV